MSDTKKIKSRKINKNVIIETENDDNSSVAEVKAESKKKTGNSVNKNKKIKARKIRMTYTAKEEKALDKAIETEDNLSITVMLVILVLCFAFGIALGYALYSIAINSSNAMIIMRYFLN